MTISEKPAYDAAAAAQMAEKPSATKDAPPTKAPSIFGLPNN
jgi:hypothetical protein